MARECIRGRDGAEFLSPFRCFLLQEPFNPFLISAPGPVSSVWSGRQYQHRHLQRPLSWNGSKCYIFIVWYLISFDWMLPFCQFSSCVAIYNLQFIAASICASTFWFSWCSGWAILLTEMWTSSSWPGLFVKGHFYGQHYLWPPSNHSNMRILCRSLAHYRPVYQLSVAI